MVTGPPKSSATSLFERAVTTYNYLFDFNRNYVSILYRIPVIASNLMKFADFNLPHLHMSPPFGVTIFKFCRDLWHSLGYHAACLRDLKFSCFVLDLYILLE